MAGGTKQARAGSPRRGEGGNTCYVPLELKVKQDFDGRQLRAVVPERPERAEVRKPGTNPTIGARKGETGLLKIGDEREKHALRDPRTLQRFANKKKKQPRLGEKGNRNSVWARRIGEKERHLGS